MTGFNIIWKSKAAENAFLELCNNARRERDLNDFNIDSGDHSKYEKSTLKMVSSEIFHRMISVAYETAMKMELSALEAGASVASILMGDVFDD
jgi:hypothetical protein